MDLFARDFNIDFMGPRRLAVAISLAFILASFVALGVRGLSLGVDFTGGTLVEVGYPEAADIDAVRNALADNGFPEAVVQNFGSTREVLVRIAPREELARAELSDQIKAILERAAGTDLEMRRVEFVGPQVGEELREDGGLAVLVALAGILIYVALRFEWRFAVGAVAALAHDVIITVGLFALLGLEFDLTVLAAVLAVIGYSLNDTIVVFDRIRENFRRIRRGDVIHVVNVALNQTLSRTLMTGLTTLLVLLALFFLGGELIHGFAIALIAGVIIGTYSSIYVASATAVALGIKREDMLPVPKEGADGDGAQV